MQRQSSQTNIIHRLNTLQSGVHFLVPTSWWNQLVSSNQKVPDVQKIIYPGDHPLKFLYQLGIIQLDFEDIKQTVTQMQQEVKSTVKQIDCKVSQIKRKEKGQIKSKRHRSQLHWWKVEFKREDLYLNTLVSPKIKLQQYYELFDDGDWRVVNSTVYYMFTNYKRVTNNQLQQEYTIGIPVHLQKLGKCFQYPYRIEQQMRIQIYYHNLKKRDHCFVGYIQSKQKVDYDDFMIQLLNDVVSHKFCGQQEFQSQYWAEIEEGNNVFNVFTIHKVKGKLYHTYKDHNQKIYDQLNWVHTNKMGKKELVNFKDARIIEISVQCSAPQEEKNQSFKRTIDYHDVGLFSRKKVKENEGFHQYHESAEGQTQQSKTQKSFKLQQTKLQYLTNILKNGQNPRIFYPIFKQEQNVSHLRKISQQRMKRSIDLPFSISQNRINLMSSENETYLIDRSCNKFELKDGQYQQIFEKQKIINLDSQEDQAKKPQINKQVIQRLQRLALNIIFPQEQMTQEKQQLFVEKQQVLLDKQQITGYKQYIMDNMKQKMDLESLTEKMQENQQQLSSPQT